MSRGVHIAVVNIPPHIEAKIRAKHKLTGNDVRAAFVLQSDVLGSWNDHAVYGRRYVALGRGHDGRLIIAWFYEVADGVWNLGTARYVDPGRG